jgi:hypothetical protein
MTRKFEVIFPSNHALKPSLVFVSPSPHMKDMYAVGILYVTKTIPSSFNPYSIQKHFDFEQSIFPTEQQAIDWAKNWLETYLNITINLSEI